MGLIRVLEFYLIIIIIILIAEANLTSQADAGLRVYVIKKKYRCLFVCRNALSPRDASKSSTLDI